MAEYICVLTLMASSILHIFRMGYFLNLLFYWFSEQKGETSNWTLYLFILSVLKAHMMFCCFSPVPVFVALALHLLRLALLCCDDLKFKSSRVKWGGIVVRWYTCAVFNLNSAGWKRGWGGQLLLSGGWGAAVCLRTSGCGSHFRL